MGIDCPFENFTGDDALEFVRAENLDRRHLDTAQRAKAAAKLANLINGSNQHEKKVGGSIDPPSKDEGVALARAADLLGVSRKSVVRARKIEREATPEASHSPAMKRDADPLG